MQPEQRRPRARRTTMGEAAREAASPMVVRRSGSSASMESAAAASGTRGSAHTAPGRS